MQRSSIIATVVAAGGILIAGSVASVAVISAASSSTTDTQTVALVGAETESTSEALAPAAPAFVPAPTATPTVEAAELPAIPDVTTETPASQPVAAQQSRPVQAAPAKPSSDEPKQTSSKPSKRPTAKATPTPTAEDPEVREISGDRARDLVLESTGGGVTKSVEKASRGGYDAYAVRVLRHDGSLVTGYVERSTGTIFDWVVNEPAAQPTSNSGSGESHDDDDDEDEDHDSHESEGGDDD